MLLNLVLPVIESILNRALKADLDALEKIVALKNQIIEINCDDWNIVFYIVPDAHGLQFYKNYSGEINTAVKGTLNNFLHIFIKGADTKTVFSYPIDIEGNTHNIEILRDVFKNLDVDFEGRLSHFLGDSIAHKLCFHVGETKKTLKKTSEKLVNQTKEYIYFEAKNFPTRKQVEKFYNDIAKLRDDVERADARMSGSRGGK